VRLMVRRRVCVQCVCVSSNDAKRFANCPVQCRSNTFLEVQRLGSCHKIYWHTKKRFFAIETHTQRHHKSRVFILSFLLFVLPLSMKTSSPIQIMMRLLLACCLFVVVALCLSATTCTAKKKSKMSGNCYDRHGCMIVGTYAVVPPQDASTSHSTAPVSRSAGRCPRRTPRSCFHDQTTSDALALYHVQRTTTGVLLGIKFSNAEDVVTMYPSVVSYPTAQRLGQQYDAFKWLPNEDPANYQVSQREDCWDCFCVQNSFCSGCTSSCFCSEQSNYCR